MKKSCLVILLLLFNYSLAQNKVSIGKITLEALSKDELYLTIPQYDKYIIVEIWMKYDWDCYIKNKRRLCKNRTFFDRTAGYCSKRGEITSYRAVTPGKHVLRVVFDYNIKSKKREYVKVLDTRKRRIEK